jgi:hypothetical protein
MNLSRCASQTTLRKPNSAFASLRLLRFLLFSEQEATERTERLGN